MRMSDSFERSGSWLFRYRSFLPLCVLPLLFTGLHSFHYIEHSHFKTELWQTICFCISLSGLALRVFLGGYVPRGTSGRNTHKQVATELNTTGIYSLMRHPLYLGNYLAVIGFALFFHEPWMVLLLTCLFALYYERIMFAEEKFLFEQFGEQFTRWAAVTPAVIPRLRGWVPSSNRFCWRTALRREYTGVMLVIGGFSVLDAVADSLEEGRLKVDWVWVGMFAGAVLAYLVLRTLKKHTRLLRVAGR